MKGKTKMSPSSLLSGPMFSCWDDLANQNEFRPCSYLIFAFTLALVFSSKRSVWTDPKTSFLQEPRPVDTTQALSYAVLYVERWDGQKYFRNRYVSSGAETPLLPLLLRSALLYDKDCRAARAASIPWSNKPVLPAVLPSRPV